MATPIAPGRFPIRIGGKPILRMPMKTGMWLAEPYDRWVEDAFFVGRPQPHIKRALILIHGASLDKRAEVYALRGYDAAERAGLLEETLVIALDLLREEWLNTEYASLLDLRLEPSLIHWLSSGMFTGGHSKLEAAVPATEFPEIDAQQIGPIPPRNGQVGIFEVLNQIISYLVKSGDYPNLRSIVVGGQSGGGNTVARYAALGLFDPTASPVGGDLAARTLITRPPGSTVEVSYLIMSAVFLYFDDRRFELPPASPNSRALTRMTEFTDRAELPAQFAVPSDRSLDWALRLEGSTKSVDWLRGRYNQYEYGTENLDGPMDDPFYGQGFGADAAPINFANRRVTILAGSKDFEKAVHPARNLQGVNSAHRALLYREHLKGVGVWNDDLHTVNVVDGVGHHGRALMLSTPGLAALFPELPEPAPGTLPIGRVDPGIRLRDRR